MFSAGRIWGACLCLATAACRISEAKIYNLAQLHDDESHHRYNAALESDLEFVLRHKVLGAFSSKNTDLTDKKASEVEAPADECLENLIELSEIETNDPVVLGRQIEWFARLAVEDPWSLSRERAVIALQAAGQRLASGLPRGLGSDQTPATPDAVGEAANGVVKAMRLVLDRQATRADLEAACERLKKLDLDIGGARRALRITIELLAAGGSRDADLAPLAPLATHLEKLCIARALALAIDDKDARVQAAALASTAMIGGQAAVDAVLYDRLQKRSEPAVTIAIVDTLRRLGRDALVDGRGGKSREDWLRAIYALVETSRESEVRVHAMMALAKLSDSGLTSLREEDWQAWWYARQDARATTDAGAAR